MNKNRQPYENQNNVNNEILILSFNMRKELLSDLLEFEDFLNKLIFENLKNEESLKRELELFVKNKKDEIEEKNKKKGKKNKNQFFYLYYLEKLLSDSTFKPSKAMSELSFKDKIYFLFQIDETNNLKLKENFYKEYELNWNDEQLKHFFLFVANTRNYLSHNNIIMTLETKNENHFFNIIFSTSGKIPKYQQNSKKEYIKLFSKVISSIHEENKNNFSKRFKEKIKNNEKFSGEKNLIKFMNTSWNKYL